MFSQLTTLIFDDGDGFRFQMDRSSDEKGIETREEIARKQQINKAKHVSEVRYFTTRHFEWI